MEFTGELVMDGLLKFGEITGCPILVLCASGV
jgi:hypothetical protein